MKYDSRAAILISSCISYSDTWPLIHRSFQYYWPFLPFKVFLGTDTFPSHIDKSEFPLFDFILADPSLSWTECICCYISQIPFDNLIFFLDDFFLLAHVNDSQLSLAIDDFLALNIDVLRLCRLPCPSLPSPLEHPRSPRIRLTPRFLPYRVNTQVSLWKSSTLAYLASIPLSPWAFEAKLSQAANLMPFLFAEYSSPVFSYDHFVEKSKWKPSVIEYAEFLGTYIPRGRNYHTPDSLNKTVSGALVPMSFVFYFNSSVNSLAYFALTRNPALCRFILILVAFLRLPSSVLSISRFLLQRRYVLSEQVKPSTSYVDLSS